MVRYMQFIFDTINTHSGRLLGMPSALLLFLILCQQEAHFLAGTNSHDTNP